jgi:hypothetical protein
MKTYRVAGLLLVELQAVLHLVIDTLGLQGRHTYLHTIYYMNIYGCFRYVGIVVLASLTVIENSATAQGSIPASSDTAESEMR